MAIEAAMTTNPLIAPVAEAGVTNPMTYSTNKLAPPNTATDIVLERPESASTPTVQTKTRAITINRSLAAYNP